MSEIDTSRRQIVLGVAAAGAALPVLAACGSGSGSGSNSGSDVTGSPASGGSTTPGGSSSSGGSGAIPTSEIPVGGGKIFPDDQYVVTQPKAGEFKAFSSTCTHQGCTVNAIADGKIDCPCHGSQYSIVDGSVQAGPAPSPLPPKTVTPSADGKTLTVS